MLIVQEDRGAESQDPGNATLRKPREASQVEKEWYWQALGLIESKTGDFENGKVECWGGCRADLWG